MTAQNFQILNAEKHQQLGVITTYSPQLGDSVMYSPAFPMEFRDVQSCYPIFFTKDAQTGQFYPVALFGFEPEQNLFLKDDAWQATYIPLSVSRQPFLIARPPPAAPGDPEPSAMVSIDMDHPKLSSVSGERLFDERGGQTQFLKTAIEKLENLHQGLAHGSQFVAALLAHNLIESFTLEITFIDGAQCKLDTFYTIAEEVLYKLPGDTLASLNKQGYLQAIFMQLASFSQLRALIARRNAGRPTADV